ncbi:hypothetical protein [Trinickia acidisoli]|uniref:hypothetical protein n=1 Tax=Trinickia acidisoli TaxID=2767482 RepID=UPI001A908303|nr:hypothetical protein [Trinickia acidisoli]
MLDDRNADRLARLFSAQGKVGQFPLAEWCAAPIQGAAVQIGPRFANDRKPWFPKVSTEHCLTPDRINLSARDRSKRAQVGYADDRMRGGADTSFVCCQGNADGQRGTVVSVPRYLNF